MKLNKTKISNACLVMITILITDVLLFYAFPVENTYMVDVPCGELWAAGCMKNKAIYTKMPSFNVVVHEWMHRHQGADEVGPYTANLMLFSLMSILSWRLIDSDEVGKRSDKVTPPKKEVPE